MSKEKPYFCNCVSWDAPDLPVLEYLIDGSTDIRRAMFLKHVDRDAMREMEVHLGYGRGGIKMKDDYHVSYHLEPVSGVAFFKHSAIEFVFATDDDIAVLRSRVADIVDDDETLSI